MPGRGDQPRDRASDPLGGLKEEVRSTLKLLFRNVEQRPINLVLPAGSTAYITEIPAQSYQVSLETPAIRISDDPIRAIRSHAKANSLALLDQAQLADNLPCAFAPVTAHEPVFIEMTFTAESVSFENLAKPACTSWPAEKIQGQASRKEIERPTKPKLGEIATEKFQAKTFSISDRLPKIQTMNNPRFYGLPIKKSPIPPHRFPASLRERFKQALAEKAETSPNNVQLRIVFERMDMSLYASIQQDDLGNLLCTPRNELLGKNRMVTKTVPGGSNSAYLVYGFRLDNRADIRAMVPVSVRDEEAGRA